MPRIPDGTRVRLPANPDEGWELEYGTVLGYGMGGYMVQLDECYRINEWDDGLRDVAPEHLEVFTPTQED